MSIKFSEILKNFLKVFFEIEHIEKLEKKVLFFPAIVITGRAAFNVLETHIQLSGGAKWIFYFPSMSYQYYVFFAAIWAAKFFGHQN